MARLLPWVVALSICTLVVKNEAALTKRSCDEVRECLKPFPMLVDTVEKDKVAALSVLGYDVLLDFVCSKKDELESCLNRAYCSDVQESYVGSAVLDTLKFLCGDGRDDFLSVADCFARDVVDSNVGMCSTLMVLQTEIATLQVMTEIADTDAYCDVFNKMFTCVRDKVSNSCSTKAQDFAYTLYSHMVKSLVAQFGCRLLNI